MGDRIAKSTGTKERNKTSYPFVFFIDVKRTGTTELEKSFSIKFKCPVDSKYYEVQVGVEHSDKMTAAKANKLRVKHIDGELLPKSVRAAQTRTAQALYTRYMNSVDKREVSLSIVGPI